MSLAAAEAIAICEGASIAGFVGPRPAGLIEDAEAALGIQLPPSYRLFVERLGAGGIGSFEVYGVIDDPFEGPVPDAVWVTLTSRSSPSQLPASMVVIGDDGMGGDYVLDIARGAEPPVEVWYGGVSVAGQQLEQMADDFGTFLLQRVLRETSA